MIVCEPFANERIPVTNKEKVEINQVVDRSARKWGAPDYVVDLFAAANESSEKKVYLRSEGWHQCELYKGEWYSHVSLHYRGWTYHLYTKVKSARETITPDTHTIDYISYESGPRYFVNLTPTS